MKFKLCLFYFQRVVLAAWSIGEFLDWFGEAGVRCDGLRVLWYRGAVLVEDCVGGRAGQYGLG